MKKVNIQICLGTTCFVMGGGALQTMAEELTRRFGDKIAVFGVSLLQVLENTIPNIVWGQAG